ncbi:MAG: TlpA disulfide reductase family protein [Bacteroidales bacterium]|nr:TlpA disulfide reductase family protein [Bacteroidales bacterium]
MMNRQMVFVVLLALLPVLSCFGQRTGSLPELNVQTLQGREFNTASFGNEGKPYVISFWATWCRPCLKELNAIDEIYHEWQEHGFKLIAVSTDDARTRHNVLPMVSGRGWEYEFYLDENGDFRRAMGVNMVPHTFILNGNNEIVYQHTSFTDGMEWQMFDLLLELLEGDE